MTAASVTTSSAAISRMDAGMATGRSDASGRHSAARTSRSRRVSSGIAVAADSLRSTGEALLGRTLPDGKVNLTSGGIPGRRLRTYGAVNPATRQRGSAKEHRDAVPPDRHLPSDGRHVRRRLPDRLGARRPRRRLPRHPGFLAYAFADLGDGINCSVSTWTTAEAADAATAAARTWVAANIADLGQLIEDRTGRIGIVIGELAAATA